MADRVIELVNQERTSRGLQPLLKHDGLMVAAAARAKELSQRYSHTRPNGSECFTILWHLGIDYGYAGENIAMGQRTPEIVMNDWMNSSALATLWWMATPIGCSCLPVTLIYK